MKNLYVLSLLSFFLANEIYSQTVQIGNQVWMSSNLDVSTFRNGDPIPEAKTKEEWNTACEKQLPAYCYYNYDKEKGQVFGKIYNYYAISDYRGLAPSGFRIPSSRDWETLGNTVSNYDNYVRLNGKPDWNTWKVMNDEGTKKLVAEPKFGIEVSYYEHGGYDETKWVACDNCSYWTEQQKKNNACSVCRNQRGKYVKTGKFIPKTKDKIEKKIIISGCSGGNNQSGFSCLFGGSCGDGYFYGINERELYWSTTKYLFRYTHAQPPRPDKWGIEYCNIKQWEDDKRFGFYSDSNEEIFEFDGKYVRCIKD